MRKTRWFGKCSLKRVRVRATEMNTFNSTDTCVQFATKSVGIPQAESCSKEAASSQVGSAGQNAAIGSPCCCSPKGQKNMSIGKLANHSYMY